MKVRDAMKPVFWIFALFALTGCRLHDNFKKTVILEPMHFAEYVAESTERRRYRRLADEVYDSVMCVKDARSPAETPFEEGFNDGFVEYMVAGRTVLPPLLPPRKYWNKHNQNPAGKCHAQQWFSGYEIGATAARDGGYRDLVTIPLSPYACNDLCPSTVPTFSHGTTHPLLGSTSVIAEEGDAWLESEAPQPALPAPPSSEPPVDEPTLQANNQTTSPATASNIGPSQIPVLKPLAPEKAVGTSSVGVAPTPLLDMGGPSVPELQHGAAIRSASKSSLRHNPFKVRKLRRTSMTNSPSLTAIDMGGPVLRAVPVNPGKSITQLKSTKKSSTDEEGVPVLKLAKEVAATTASARTTDARSRHPTHTATRPKPKVRSTSFVTLQVEADNPDPSSTDVGGERRSSHSLTRLPAVERD